MKSDPPPEQPVNLLTASANLKEAAVNAGWPEHEAKGASLMFDDYLAGEIEANPVTRSLYQGELEALLAKTRVEISAGDNSLSFQFALDGVNFRPVLKRSDARKTAKAAILD